MPASERKPGTDQVAPDPAASYGREDPAQESGQGRLSNPPAPPSRQPDREKEAVDNRHAPRQINADDALAGDAASRAAARPLAAPDQPDHSMHDEEPTGWDQAPNDIKNPEQKRHPRTEGRGGTP